jgi:hypothetical protein
MALFIGLGLFFFFFSSPLSLWPAHEWATWMDPSPTLRRPSPPASTVRGRVSTAGPLLHAVLSRTGPPLPSSLRHALLDPTSLSHFFPRRHGREAIWTPPFSITPPCDSFQIEVRRCRPPHPCVLSVHPRPPEHLPPPAFGPPLSPFRWAATQCIVASK